MKTEFTVRGDVYPDDAFEFKTSWPHVHPAYIAEDAAECYFTDHDGWEDNWPIEFEIFLDGKSAGVFSVALYHVPSFSAEEIK